MNERGKCWFYLQRAIQTGGCMPCVSTKKNRWYWIRVARRLCNRCGRKSNPQPRRLLQRRRNPARRDGQGVWVGLVKRCWDRLPQYPHCTNNLTQGLEPFQKGTATEKRYIQAQPAAMRLYLIFDVDRPNGGPAGTKLDQLQSGERARTYQLDANQSGLR